MTTAPQLTAAQTADLQAFVHARAVEHAHRLRSAAIAHAGRSLYQRMTRASRAAPRAKHPIFITTRTTSGV